MQEKVNRMERRKQITREVIIATAVELFKQKSSIEVSFENIADKADISRKTLYNHFSSKEDLIFEVISPIFNDGNQYIDFLASKEKIVLEDIWSLCIYLWEHFGNRLELLYNVDFEEHKVLLDMHASYMSKFQEMFKKAADLPASLNVPCWKIALMVYKCFVPVLSIISDMQNRDELFKNIMMGIVKGFYYP